MTPLGGPAFPRVFLRPRKYLESKVKMVEAAGIEPASAWRPINASTCVVLAQIRDRQSRGPGEPSPYLDMDLVSGYGREALGDQPSSDSRYPLEGVTDGSH